MVLGEQAIYGLFIQHFTCLQLSHWLPINMIWNKFSSNVSPLKWLGYLPPAPTPSPKLKRFLSFPATNIYFVMYINYLFQPGSRCLWLPSSNGSCSLSAFWHHNCLSLYSVNPNLKILHFSFPLKLPLFSQVVFITGFPNHLSISLYHLAFCKTNTFWWNCLSPVTHLLLPLFSSYSWILLW